MPSTGLDQAVSQKSCQHHILRILEAVWPPQCQVHAQHTWNEQDSTRNTQLSLNVGSMITPPIFLPLRTSYCLEGVWWQLLCMWQEPSAEELKERFSHYFSILFVGVEGLWKSFAHYYERILKISLQVTPLVSEEECEGEVGRYLNRLSDFLFTLARCLLSFWEYGILK